ncbi:MAG: Pyrrolo-quinoline quinone [Caulobacter sp.]|nr:Pyrrolo-quinoline quinone [Caulobacter sp.]
MMSLRLAPALALAATLCLAGGPALANELDLSKLGKPPTDTWPTFNGDYSGRRFSTLNQINDKNIGQIALQWKYKISDVGAQRGAPAPVIKATPLLVNGVLYFTIPNRIYAVDSRTGKEIWTYSWTDKGGHLVGNRGVGMYKDSIFFLGPDNWIICVDSATGKERWRKEIADARQQYFTTTAPLVIGKHLLIGVGGDAMDIQGFLLSLDPETGDIQWRWDSTPKAGEPGIETWPNAEAAAHGGGMTWLPGTYDKDLNLIYWGTGNTNPVYAGQGRKGANLYTASIVALNLDTGKLAWHFQVSPHDTHDWDNIETPVLFDTVINGKPRKLLAQAARNGYFVVLDRTNGDYLVSKPYVDLNWSLGIDKRGQPIPNPDKDPSVAGSMTIGSATNWMAPSYNPDTGLFYVNAVEAWNMYYLIDTDPKPAGYGGSGAGLGVSTRVLKALDVKTGDIRWEHRYPNLNGAPTTLGPSILTTAGKLLVTGDDQHNLIVYRPADGEILWNMNLPASLSNGPMTYMQDNRQWLITGAGDTLYAFTLPKP